MKQASIPKTPTTLIPIVANDSDGTIEFSSDEESTEEFPAASK
jgi:hypothetical protein